MEKEVVWTGKYETLIKLKLNEKELDENKKAIFGIFNLLKKLYGITHKRHHIVIDDIAIKITCLNKQIYPEIRIELKCNDPESTPLFYRLLHLFEVVNTSNRYHTFLCPYCHMETSIRAWAQPHEIAITLDRETGEEKRDIVDEGMFEEEQPIFCGECDEELPGDIRVTAYGGIFYLPPTDKDYYWAENTEKLHEINKEKVMDYLEIQYVKLGV